MITKEDRKNLTDSYVKKAMRRSVKFKGVLLTPDLINEYRNKIIRMRDFNKINDDLYKIQKRKCKKCELIKDIIKFVPRPFGRTKNGYESCCTDCANKAKVNNHKINPKIRNNQSKKRTEVLQDSYIKVRLKSKNIEVNPETIDLQKSILLIKRFKSKNKEHGKESRQQQQIKSS